MTPQKSVGTLKVQIDIRADWILDVLSEVLVNRSSDSAAEHELLMEIAEPVLDVVQKKLAQK